MGTMTHQFGDDDLVGFDETIKFLRWLAPEGPWALTAITPDTGKVEGCTFFPSKMNGVRDWLRSRNGAANLYFHINEVREDFRGTKAKKTDIHRVHFLHVDIDPTPGKDIVGEQKRILALLTEALPSGVPRPSAIIFSGGGYQAFWKLKGPISIGGNQEQAQDAERYNQCLEQKLGGDNCHNVDRIMRLPGTLNIPDARKRKKGRVEVLARLESFNDITYSLSEFEQAEPNSKSGANAKKQTNTNRGEAHPRVKNENLDKWNVPDRVKTILLQGYHPDEPKAGDNSRSVWLFDAICSLIRCGVPDDTIRAIITDPAFKISESVLDRGPGKSEKCALRQIERAHQKIAETENSDLSKMNARHAVIQDYGGHTRVMTERQPPNPPQFQSVDDFCNGRLNETIQVVDKNKKRKLKPLARWWLEHRRCRVFKRAEFLPGRETEDDVFNLWRGWTVEPREGDCSKFLSFVLDIICAGNTMLAEWLLNWMAHAVQRPFEPGEVAVALRGGQGIGKSFFVEHFGEFFGKHFVALTDPKHIVGNFNAILRDALLVFADEAFAPNDKRAEGILKGLVTQSHITVEPKGVDAFKTLKYLRLVLASNHEWVIPAEGDDRRFLMLDVSAARKRDHQFFKEIMDEWNSGGREAFMHFLMHRDISKFNHRVRPETAALTDQKLYSLRGAQRVIYEMLCKGDAPSLKCDETRVFVTTKELHSQSGGKCSEAALGRELARIAYEHRSTRETIGGKQQRGYWLPPLGEARQRWAEAVGINPRWPDDDGHWECVVGEPCL